jgi:hypothetical protein
MSKPEHLTVLLDLNPKFWFSNPSISSDFLGVLDIFLNTFLSLSSQNQLRLYLFDSERCELLFDSLQSNNLMQQIGSDYE